MGTVGSPLPADVCPWETSKILNAGVRHLELEHVCCHSVEKPPWCDVIIVHTANLNGTCRPIT